LTEYVEDYIQLPPDGVGKKVRAIKRPDNRYEEVTIPLSLNGEVDLKTLTSRLEEIRDKIPKQLEVAEGLLYTKEPYLENPSFETGDLRGWKVEGDVKVIEDSHFQGKYCAKLMPAAKITQAVPPTFVTEVLLGLSSKADAIGQTLKVICECAGVTYTLSITPELTWKRRTIWSKQLYRNYNRLWYIVFEADQTNTAPVYIDNIEIEKLILGHISEWVDIYDWRLKIRNDEKLTNLDVLLSTRASEATLSSVLDRNALVKKDTLKELDAYSLGAGLSHDVDVAVPNGRCGVITTLKATYDSLATKGVKLEIYTSPDGIDWDTDTDEIYEHPFKAGEARQKPYITSALHPNIRVRIINLDPTYAVTIDLWRTFI